MRSPKQGTAVLFDQPLDDLDLHRSDFITETEFENIWEERDDPQ